MDNTGLSSNNNTRIADTQAFTLAGGSFVYKGSDQSTTNSTETIGALSGAGNSTVTVTFGSTNGATLTAASFSHTAGNATDLVNGVNLGKNSTDTTSFARFISTSTPTLTGTTTAVTTGAGTVKNLKIVPFLVGESSSGLGTATGTANTFVTYVAGSGFRPLDTTNEFTPNAFTSGNNTYITSATAAAANTSINSLVVNGGDVSINDGFTLTNTSGALLFASSNAIKPTGTTGIYTGSAESQITVNSGVTGTISAIISGTQALTKSGAGTLVLSGANTFSGITTNAAGTLNVANANALQNSTLVFAPNAATSGLTFAPNIGTFTIAGLTGSTNAANILTLTDTNSQAVNLQVGNGNVSSTFGSGISGGTVTKIGTGTWTLNSGNNITSAVVVNNGTVFENGTVSLQNVPSLTINNGGLVYYSRGSLNIAAGAASDTVTINSGGASLPTTSATKGRTTPPSEPSPSTVACWRREANRTPRFITIAAVSVSERLYRRVVWPSPQAVGPTLLRRSAR